MQTIGEIMIDAELKIHGLPGKHDNVNHLMKIRILREVEEQDWIAVEPKYGGKYFNVQLSYVCLLYRHEKDPFYLLEGYFGGIPSDY